MLFDLRGRGRRTTVRVVYTGLALLLGVGLIGFGIGGGFGGGGFLNAASQNEGSGSASFASQIKKYRKLTSQQPTNAEAWEKLLRAQLHEAGGEAYVTSTGALTSKGRELFAQAGETWSRYLALNPPKPSVELAQQMLRVYGEEGLNKPAEEVQILQIVVAAKPTNVAYYAQLAKYAYAAKNMRVGDLAAAKAVSLAPAAQKARLKTELVALRKSPSGGTSSNEVLTATTNGKTYTVKPGANGSFTGTVPATKAPAPTKK
ncbi:MAG TPA: hypothetical protein VHY83_11765 [Solirubrobacteraceae bacterium]|jgi:predicted Zn-dependent protease|nr:hypothetical protein [Solirubrobacteraceae bacterium]